VNVVGFVSDVGWVPHNLERNEVPPCGKDHEFRQSNKCDAPSQALIELDGCIQHAPRVFWASRAGVTYECGGTNTTSSRMSGALERLHGSTL
jgi:hypothetical protein